MNSKAALTKLATQIATLAGKLKPIWVMIKTRLTPIWQPIVGWLRWLLNRLPVPTGLRLRLERRRLRVLELVLAAYLILAIVVGILYYGFQSQHPLVIRSLAILPFPAAYAKGAIIWAKQLEDQTIFIRHFSSRTNQSISDEQIRNQVLNQLIDDRLVRFDAARHNLRVNRREVDEAFKKIAEENGGEKTIANILQNLYGMRIIDFKKLIRDQLVKDRVREKLLVQVRVRQILIRDEKRAQEILDKIKNGESFEELAKKFSEDTNSRENGGDLGFLSRGQTAKEFDEVAFALKPGELQPSVVKTEFGFHIIKLEERRGEIDKSFDSYLNDLKKNARVIRLAK